MRENLATEVQARATRAQTLYGFLPDIPSVNEYLHGRMKERHAGLVIGHVSICSLQWPGAMRTRLLVLVTAARQSPNKCSSV